MFRLPLQNISMKSGEKSVGKFFGSGSGSRFSVTLQNRSVGLHLKVAKSENVTRSFTSCAGYSSNYNDLLHNSSMHKLLQCGSWQLTLTRGVASSPDKPPKKAPQTDPSKLVQRDTNNLPYSELTMGEKAKRGAQDTLNITVVVACVAVLGYICYAIYEYVITPDSVTAIFSKALKQCQENAEVVKALGGGPIKGYGEGYRRRRHPAETEFYVQGVLHKRVKFYIKGKSKWEATVHVEVQKTAEGKIETRYLYVQLPGAYVRDVIVIEDNRYKLDHGSLSTQSSGSPSQPVQDLSVTSATPSAAKTLPPPIVPIDEKKS